MLQCNPLEFNECLSFSPFYVKIAELANEACLDASDSLEEEVL